MPELSEDLWALALDRQQLDPTELWRAIERQIESGQLDFRTRVLIRDSLQALAERFGQASVRAQIAASPVRDQVDQIWKSDLGAPGFPSLRGRIMEPTRADTIERFFRDLSRNVRRPIGLYVGGSAALILRGTLTRRTEDVDVVDEVPAELREQHGLLQTLAQVHNLHLAHFQSHYLPSGWQGRAASFGTYGDLQIFLVDVYDIFLSKLFSARVKDRQDLAALSGKLDKQSLVDRFKLSTAALQRDPKLSKHAADNWYTLFGEPLPG